MTTPSAYLLEQAMSAAMRILAETDLPDDEQLRRDTIDGQTNALDQMDALAEAIIADEALAERGRDRARRLAARANRRRQIVLAMLEALQLGEPVERALYTASLTHTRHVMIINLDEIPDEFLQHTPDKRRIGAALRKGDVPGTTLSNPMPSLTISVR